MPEIKEEIQYSRIAEGIDVAYTPYTGDPTGTTHTGCLRLAINTHGITGGLITIQLAADIASNLRDYLNSIKIP